MEARGHLVVARSSVGVLLVDHGSPLAVSNSLTEDLAVKIGCSLGQDDGAVLIQTCHMEGPLPDIASGFADLSRTGIHHVLVIPLFIAPGKHLQQDIPWLCQQAADKLGMTFDMRPSLVEDNSFVSYLAGRVSERLNRTLKDADPPSNSGRTAVRKRR